MKTLYLDIFSGISGDMMVGALLDLGADLRALEHTLAGLGLNGFHLHVSRQQRQGISGTKFDVHLTDELDHHHTEPRPQQSPAAHHHELVAHGGQHHDADAPPAHEHGQHHHTPAHGAAHHGHGHAHGRDFADIRALIEGSSLSPWVKEKAVAIFRRLAVAEGRIHGRPPEEVHFHEVGAVDSIVDVVGACVALELLGRPRVLAAPVQEGTGWIHCAHGKFPIPAPATLEILAARGIPVTQSDEPHELVTPTGAALLAELVQDFGPLRGLHVEKIGYGLGSRENKTRPNVLRALLGRLEPAGAAVHDWEADTVAMLECNLDDTSPEILGRFVELALARGALDVFHTPVQMKKNRPGILLTLLCPEDTRDAMAELVLRETSAFGVRWHPAERRKLRREFQTVATPFGEVTVKLGRLDGRIVQVAPEFESCHRLALQADVPLRRVYDAALRAAPPLQ
ncbi:MAG TPA: nickel pincer cofactor biosynthesis protein LarC [Methylomirabilota bacterium]|nr:nickel pincer cofactor biosynthesis protein LarC [Methylomirabilota bacterium]